jgi:hypothetical protein
MMEEWMSEDWTAVASALRQRMGQKQTTMTELAARSGISLTTVRELVHVLNTRHRRPRTLSALSTTLGWNADHLFRVLHGEPTSDTSSHDDLARLRKDVVELQHHVKELRSRLEAVEGAGVDRSRTVEAADAGF